MKSMGVGKNEPESSPYETEKSLDEKNNKVPVSNAAPIVVSSEAAPAKLWKMISLFLVVICTALLVAFVLALVIDPNSDKDNNEQPASYSYAAPGGGLCSLNDEFTDGGMESEEGEGEAATSASMSQYAQFMCSNGTFFYDTAGMSGCACAQGYVGKECEVMLPNDNVIVNARSKTSTSNMLMEGCWQNSDSMNDDNIGLVSMKSSYRIGYNWGMGPDSSLMGQIEEQVRQLHEKIGNIDTAGKNIVFGGSFDLLLQAAVYGMSDYASVSSVTGGISTTYPMYWKDYVQYYDAKHFTWVDGRDAVDGNNVIELMMSPSYTSPIAFEAMPTTSENAKSVVDRTKYWPQYAGKTIPEVTQSDDVAIFSLCEASGHCGSRMAWAVVKDPMIAMNMWKYVGKISMNLPRDVQLRANVILDIVLDRTMTETCPFRHAKGIMSDRWMRLQDVMSQQSKLTLMANDGTPAYAMVECGVEGKMYTPSQSDLMQMQNKLVNSSSALRKMLSSTNQRLLSEGCGAYMLYKANIATHDNSDTQCPKMDNSHAFLDLTMNDADFDLLINQLSNFAAMNM